MAASECQDGLSKQGELGKRYAIVLVESKLWA